MYSCRADARTRVRGWHGTGRPRGGKAVTEPSFGASFGAFSYATAGLGLEPHVLDRAPPSRVGSHPAIRDVERVEARTA